MERYHPASTALKNELKHHKKRLTQDQISQLESSFSLNNKLDPDRKSQLAQELGLPPRKISIWYQNKRARWKTESLEEDYKALKLRLESLLADNQRLQSEVDRLKLELQKAREMIFTVNNNNNHGGGTNYNSSLSSQLSSSCDEVGSSNLVHDHHHHHYNHGHHGSEEDHLDKVDLFACLIGGGQGQFGAAPNDHEFFPSSIS